LRVGRPRARAAGFFVARKPSVSVKPPPSTATYLAPWEPWPSGRAPHSGNGNGNGNGHHDGVKVLEVSRPLVRQTRSSAPRFMVPSKVATLTAGGAVGHASAPSGADLPAPSLVRPLPESLSTYVPTSRLDRWLQRALEALPLAAALLLITSLGWGALWLPLPLTALLLGFDCYWVWRSYNTAYHCIKGYWLLRREAGVDWRARYEEARARGEAYLRWEDVRHVVLIPTYKETVAKLSATLSKLAESDVAREQIFVVLAMEEAEPGCRRKALRLYREFGDSFAGMFATFHPANIPSEVRGKSSNEAWAARHIERRLVEEMGYDIDHLTITSCDADTLFHPHYFSCLTHKFATHPQRHRRFWQAPILLYNNIWDVPAPLRIPNGLGGLNHLGRLVRKYRVLFPQSTYSLSFQMAREVGYWDVDVVPEDWHMFLKCFFELGGEVDVELVPLPLGNDGVRSEGYLKTFFAHYQQARRHAWGASDIPYAIRRFFAHPEIPLLRRLRRTWSLVENHLLWSSQWFLITTGRLAPWLVFYLFGVKTMPTWFVFASTKLLFTCSLPLIAMVIMDGVIMRPRRPSTFPVWLFPVQYAQWFFMAAITFLFGALPALDAQIRLALGKRLEYKVTEKA
jgi:hypothetical protein